MKCYFGSIQHASEKTEEVHPDITGTRYSDNLFSLIVKQTSEQQEFFEDEDTVIFIDGFDYHENQGGANVLNSLYQQYGDAFIQHITGEFVIIVWDKKKQALFCYRDHFGTRPFYYLENDSGLFFSNDLRILRSCLTTAGFDEEWMADLFAGTVSDTHVTPYHRVYRLPPAHSLVWEPGKKCSINKYWDLDLEKEQTNISEADAIEQFRFLLERAVHIRIPKHGVIGSELSGGLDSTVVASLANGFCKESNLDFHAFSHVMEGTDLEKHFPFHDERNYIKQVVDFCNIENNHLIAPGGADILTTLEHGLRIQGAPTQQRFYEFSDLLYTRAKTMGVEILFSGFGGDEGVSSHGGGYLHELMYSNRRKDLWKELQLKNSNVIRLLYKWMMISSQVHVFGLYNKISRYTGSEYRRIHEKINQLPLKKEILKRYEVHQRAQEKSRFPNDLMLKKRQYRRIMHPHVSQRMEYTAIAAREFGIEYRYPLWDKDLIQFYINLPTDLKRRNNTGRYMYRKSIKGLIPESIRWRNDKTGATIPSVHRRLLNDAENIRKFIDSCEKKGIGTDILDMKKMKDWLEMIIRRNRDDRNIYQGMFFNYLMFLKHLEWKYEGKI